jgi:dephospho-CoA kinase
MSPGKGHPPVIGLLGGIAAGKTAVAGMLAQLGATVVSADDIGHAVLDRPAIRARIVARWGADVLGEDGRVDRGQLARKAFADPQELLALEALMHPPILDAMRQQIAQARRSPAVRAVVVDAPLLVEAGLDRDCDVLVFVDCPREVRLARVAARGWEAGELDRREGRQQALDVKRQRARFILDAHAPFETTSQQVQQLWQEILAP